MPSSCFLSPKISRQVIKISQLVEGNTHLLKPILYPTRHWLKGDAILKTTESTDSVRDNLLSVLLRGSRRYSPTTDSFL